MNPKGIANEVRRGTGMKTLRSANSLKCTTRPIRFRLIAALNCFVVSVGTGLFATSAVAAIPTAATPAGAAATAIATPQLTSKPRGTLALTNGGVVPGDLKDANSAALLRWQSPSFVSPFDFAIDAVNAVYYPSPAQRPKPLGDHCFELSGGDVLFGSLVTLDDTNAELDAAPFGHLHLKRERIERIYRWKDRADLVYLGPNGLSDWNEASRAAWTEEAGQVLTDRAGASLWGNLGIPAQAEIELVVSWKGKPDFVVALAVDEQAKTIEQAFRLEIWGSDLVVERENAREADVAAVQKGADAAGRTHLRIYLDQPRGRCLVYSHQGVRIADLTVAPDKPGIHTGMRFLNKRGDLRIEHLRVGRWTGEPPQNVAPGKARLHLLDGSIAYGSIAAFDAARREFTLRDGANETKIAADRVAAMYLKNAQNAPPELVRAVLQDGSQVSGELSQIANGAVHLTSPGITEPLKLPLPALRALIVLRHSPIASPAKPNAEAPRSGTLEMEGLRLAGQLADGQEQAQASCLVWQPQFSATSSPLLPGVRGRIVYREPPPPPATSSTPRARPANPPVQENWVGGFIGAMAGGTTKQPAQAAARALPQANKSLHLRTGDAIPCEVSRIDEQGVHFKTPLSDASFVAHNMVKAVELAPDQSVSVRLNKVKRDRLLTLPRLQKDNPPTHLIRSTNGDFLRGRVVEMNADKLQLEIHLETKELPRDRVARIIWLHADELAAEPSPTPQTPASTRVQALRSDGVRMTFQAQQVAAGTVSGKSDILGACRVDLKDVDQLVIGQAIEQYAARLAYQQWKLHNAIEPKIMDSTGADGGGGRPAGADSALVGKPAPDFTLELLRGGKFHLAGAKGKIVIVDFWATWCGPCLQAMPQIDKVAHEFADKGVQVVAVNLEEAPQPITSMLERHKLEMPVALDRDGVVAAKYGVTSIPQTLIVDREGNVVRHYIGGGPHLGEDVTAALRELLGEAQKPQPSGN